MKDVLKGMELKERIAWVSGRLILSIGEGRFRDELGLIVQIVESNAVERFKEYRKIK